MKLTNNPITDCYYLIKKFPFTKSEIRLSIFFCLVGYLFIGLFPQQVAGDTVSSENYSIDVGNIDTNPQPTPRNKVLGITNIPKINTTGYNYTITSTGDIFSFGISQNIIDFGILSSTNPILRTSALLLSGSTLGAQTLAYENHPLFSVTHDTIQNTNCDNGACTPLTAALWNNTLTFGFGYRCDSINKNVCDPQFITTNYYKAYPDNSRNQLPATMIIQNVGGQTTKATISYKVNISGTQKTGGYYNSITYLAVPNF